MKRITILILCCLTGQLFTQTLNRDITSVNPYYYENFQLGSVFFTEGDPVRALLNFNVFNNDIAFVESIGLDGTPRILSLIKRPNMTRIQIGNDVFVPAEKGWALLVVDAPIALVAKKHTVATMIGPYGVPLTTSSAQAVTWGALVRYLAAVGVESSIDVPEDAPQATSEIGGLSTPSNPGKEIGINAKNNVETNFYFKRGNKLYSATERNFVRFYNELAPELRQFLLEESGISLATLRPPMFFSVHAGANISFFTGDGLLGNRMPGYLLGASFERNFRRFPMLSYNPGVYLTQKGALNFPKDGDIWRLNYLQFPLNLIFTPKFGRDNRRGVAVAPSFSVGAGLYGSVGLWTNAVGTEVERTQAQFNNHVLYPYDFGGQVFIRFSVDKFSTTLGYQPGFVSIKPTITGFWAGDERKVQNNSIYFTLSYRAWQFSAK
jgi:hypothetical protein